MVKPTESWPETALEPLKLIPPIKFRAWWGALPPIKEEFMLMPVPYAHITYTGGEECFTEEHCTELMKTMQRRDMDQRKMLDIQYNFLIGGDGILYEGVGWHGKSTKDPEFSNMEGKCVDIAYIGDYSVKDPPEKSVRVAETFIKYMGENGYLTDDYKIVSLDDSRKAKLKVQ